MNENDQPPPHLIPVSLDLVDLATKRAIEIFGDGPEQGENRAYFISHLFANTRNSVKRIQTGEQHHFRIECVQP